VKRMAELYARRRVLIERCDAQRSELASRVAELDSSPMRWALSGAAAAVARRGGRHPLAWIVALAGVLLLGRPRQAVKLLGLTRSALTLLSRVTQVMGVLAALRRVR